MPSANRTKQLVAGQLAQGLTASGITTLNATAVDAVTVTNANLVLESLNPMTCKLNDTNALQFDNAAISSFAAAADTAGTGVYVETQDGGADTAADGAVAGGLLSIKCGDAGAAAADQNGAAGGALTVAAGTGSAGGTHSSNNPNGGNGGVLTLTAGTGGASGGGTGVAGDPGKVKISSGLLHFTNAQTIDMADAQVALTLNPGTPTGTTITSNSLHVDANSATTEDLLLPPEADCNGLMLMICNTGGEDIVVKEDGDSTTVCTISTAEVGLVTCDGTTWRGGIMAVT